MSQERKIILTPDNENGFLLTARCYRCGEDVDIAEIHQIKNVEIVVKPCSRCSGRIINEEES